MAKMIYKEKLTFDNGMVLDGDETVNIPRLVAIEAERLDLMLQEYNYLKAQPEACEGPTMDGFERESYRASHRYKLAMPDTPIMDAKAAEGKAFVAEVKAHNATVEAQHVLDEFRELVDFAQSDRFVEESCGTYMVDTPALGSILELTPERIGEVLLEIAKSPIQIEW